MSVQCKRKVYVVAGCVGLSRRMRTCMDRMPLNCEQLHLFINLRLTVVLMVNTLVINCYLTVPWEAAEEWKVAASLDCVEVFPVPRIIGNTAVRRDY